VIEGEGRVRIKARNRHSNMTLNFIGIPFMLSWSECPLRDKVRISWSIFRNLSNRFLGYELDRKGEVENVRAQPEAGL
jgi:hypothetical protein